MRISKGTHIALTAGLLALAKPVYAFDASKVIEGDASSTKFIESFRANRSQWKDDEALQVLEFAAQRGNHAAQWKLGKMYQTGDGVPVNPVEAFNFFQKLTEGYRFLHPRSVDWQFSANAFVALGHYYKTGIPEGGLRPDPKQAKVMFTTAAYFFRHPDGQFELARLDLEKAKNRRTARRALGLLKKAQKKGHVGAKALLGNAVFHGEFVRRDPISGLVMLTEAREQAAGKDFDWIAAMQEEAFALATEDERRRAIQIIDAQK